MRYYSPNIIKAKVVFLLLSSMALASPLATVSGMIVNSFLFPPLPPAFSTSMIHVNKASAGMKTLMVKYLCGFKT